ncbi:D-methionine transport system substrate-binding protein [Mesonia hippocampi]|uniref:Lipoprotein n=1 Tax=Mesonia hippocampi TaxID=1628250 RepID=A0A840EMI2_9FLAO|nr:methionine ABC transporter substrate-binding lipoprotein MetQ [Mesonia hippocampi]MBB4117843.1 D-methionine transport system substrate-binding protein [Mesonia hippocampi]
MKKIIILSFSVIGLITLFACGNSEKSKPNYIRVGITSGLEQKIAEAAKKEAKEKYGLEVELISFNNYTIPNEALNNGDIDVNVFQHVPYLKKQSEQRGYKLAIVGNTFVYPMVAYSKKIKHISELQNGSTIVIPNDPTNGGRSLLLLQKNGLLQLRDNTGLLPKVTDIIKNPKQLKIIEIEAPQLPVVLDDKQVSIAIINNNFAAQANLNPNEFGLLREDETSAYINVIVAREDNKNEEKVKKFVKAYQSEIVEKTAKNAFKGMAIKGW